MEGTRLAWVMAKAGAPLERRVDPIVEPGPGEVLVQVAGCGVCHTDVAFLHEGVKTRRPPPIVLGHEIAGMVVAAGAGSRLAPGTQVIVPAVIPCGRCDLCTRGRENACLRQIMPGNDSDGGFATHVTVPAEFLCPIDVPAPDLWMYGVVADAVATAYQAVHRARVSERDVCVIVGTGGVGGFAVQICAARGAFVVGIDADEGRLDRLYQHGLARGIGTTGRAPRDLRDELRAILKAERKPETFLKIFETSGRPAGQETALALLGPAALVSVVGYTADKISVRLSSLMAFDARVIGTWGCRPQLFPEVVALCRAGRVRLEPFVEACRLDDADSILAEVQAGKRTRRPVLCPS